MHNTFNDFGLSDNVLSAISEMGFEEPTPIQKIAIGPALKGRDLIGLAQTGTGKTAAFGIPIVEHSRKEKSKNPYAIVLAPTRELAVQVAKELSRIGENKGITTVPIYGGQSMDKQIQSLRKGVHIVVGTPGRVIDHIERKTLSLKDISMVVLDEADEMLNMGFVEDIEKILKKVPEERQTMLFSATMPDEIVRISAKYMNKPEKVYVDAKPVVAKIKQIFYEVREEDKIKALTRLLDVEEPALTLIFCHTKKDVDDVSGRLRQMGYDAGSIHGDYTQSHRDEVMNQFRRGDLDILVATDVAARGLDIPDVTHVINYSIPQFPGVYVHRIGRTGRAGKSGVAITLVSPREYRHLRLIEKTAKTIIKKANLPTRDEVIKARERELITALEEEISAGKQSKYIHLVEGLSSKYSPQDIAAAALSLMSVELEVEEIADSAAPRSSSGKGSIRLFMTIGRKDKINAGDLVRSISNETNIPMNKIGKVAIYDTFSFVEVPASLASKVIGTLDEMKMKGRRIRVQQAKERKK